MSSANRLGLATHFRRARHLQQGVVAVVPEAVAAPEILAAVSGADSARLLVQGNGGVRPLQVRDSRVDRKEGGRDQRVQSRATKRHGAFSQAAGVFGPGNGGALAQLIGALGITSDRA